MLGHYLELLRLSWKQVLACALGAGLLAYALSQFLLQANPIYEASIAITMQPSDEELLFNRTFMGVSQFNPATIIAQSHVERLLSRPVAERALDLLLAQYGGEGLAEPPTTFGLLKGAFWTAWNTLNYGYHVPPTPREQMISDIQSALDLEIVEGSYILNVSVFYDNPKIAAEVANMIVVAYAEEARADFLREASEVVATIASQEEATKVLLGERRSQRETMARLIGVNDVTTERTVALEARQSARNSLREAEIDLSGQRAELEKLRASIRGQTDPALVAEIQQGIVLGEASLERRAETVALREKALTQIEESLDDLQFAEQQMAEIDLAVQEAELDLEELQRRRVALDLATKARLSQVRVINPAVEPVYPSFPKVLINTIVATVVGGILALAPVFAIDALGNRVRTGYDLDRVAGLRALPTVSRWSLARGSGRRARGFAAVLGRRIAADGAGWASHRLLVTGDLDEATIERLRAFIATAVDAAAPAPAGTCPREVIALPPLGRVDWPATAGRVVVIGIPTGTLARDEVEGLLRQLLEKGARPYFMLVL